MFKGTTEDVSRGKVEIKQPMTLGEVKIFHKLLVGEAECGRQSEDENSSLWDFFFNPLGIYRGAKETRQTIALSHRTHLASVSKG